MNLSVLDSFAVRRRAQCEASVLKNAVARRLEEVLNDVAREHDWKINSLAIRPRSHSSLRPGRYSTRPVSSDPQARGTSAHVLREEFDRLHRLPSRWPRVYLFWVLISWASGHRRCREHPWRRVPRALSRGLHCKGPCRDWSARAFRFGPRVLRGQAPRHRRAPTGHVLLPPEPISFPGRPSRRAPRARRPARRRRQL